MFFTRNECSFCSSLETSVVCVIHSKRVFSVCYVKADDPELPPFYFDHIINPLPAYQINEKKIEEVKTTLVSSVVLLTLVSSVVSGW